MGMSAKSYVDMASNEDWRVENWTYYARDRVVLGLKENNMEAHHRLKVGARMPAMAGE